ncbi:MAG: hypothetical protein A2431_02790 [Candidatus Zambryskibacteria bacterium RIFOXYC1_FULL_39_10]|uniref:Uncharacterized protein n=1 Tax=Candidatus Zambryskibacteria bacterium RIFOXYC1_FULL_39_10 TaxID=1802779 RepID=A0A1G2UY10_9BACT|nr:MAG: hypothetical protein A2431_02790 [Candidatus Zambryskibacteria bacterium RIFOXYC1_FULL_39_10]OHB14805.1 MAG: hypothetical protein A2605_04090 [Candidatus Zambryskibacteria bacterium RIFOXYD1_FULL_39_35]
MDPVDLLNRIHRGYVYLDPEDFGADVHGHHLHDRGYTHDSHFRSQASGHRGIRGNLSLRPILASHWQVWVVHRTLRLGHRVLPLVLGSLPIIQVHSSENQLILYAPAPMPLSPLRRLLAPRVRRLFLVRRSYSEGGLFKLWIMPLTFHSD